MVHELLNRLRMNFGSVEAWALTLDVTDLDQDGVEVIPFGQYTGLHRPVGAWSIMRENHRFGFFMTTGDNLGVYNLSQGTQPASGTDAGEVTLLTIGPAKSVE